MFKTERIVLSKTKVVKQKNNKDNELLKYRSHFAKNKPKRKKDSNQNMFLNKKRNIFHIYNSDEFLKNEINPSNSGRWTLNEHTTFLEALDKYGVNWKKIDSLIKTRTVNQIRSHGQKFYLRLKQVKDEQLGIDFTSNTINNLNDMINHIKSINSDYDIFKVLLYISDKYSANKKGKMLDIIKKKLNNGINKNSESYINDKNINNLQNYINNNLIINSVNQEMNDYPIIGNYIYNNMILNNLSMENLNLINNYFISSYINGLYCISSININSFNNSLNIIPFLPNELFNKTYFIHYIFLNNVNININKDDINEKHL